MTTNIQQLEQLLEYTFHDRTLLVQALTHPSYLHEASKNGGGDYQRLEFLGDAVLGLLLAEMLYNRYPDWDEGALSQLRSRLAGQDILADRARMLGIGCYFLLGRGEEQTAGREKDSILADVMESLIAALYQDGGLQAARTFVVRLFEQLVGAPEMLVLGRDSKSELQEFLSSNGYPVPEYRLVEESGPPHDRIFVFQLMVGDNVVGVGQGKSKKIAQQAAAAKALDKLQSVTGQS
ncbi:MAG: ribonuclease III [Geobacteraceae bacterium]|nr:ribonuclease III [Geobacteraceae bacterium]NTW80193.1 ribonuclease III [Geobacteraceae bacterium]